VGAGDGRRDGEAVAPVAELADGGAALRVGSVVAGTLGDAVGAAPEHPPTTTIHAITADLDR